MPTRLIWSMTAVLVPLGLVAAVLIGIGGDDGSTPEVSPQTAADSPPGIPADGFFDAAQLSAQPALPPLPPPAPVVAESDADDDTASSSRVKDANRPYTADEVERNLNSYAPRPPMGPATVPTTLPEYQKQFDPPLVIPPVIPPGNTKPYHPESVGP